MFNNTEGTGNALINDISKVAHDASKATINNYIQLLDISNTLHTMGSGSQGPTGTQGPPGPQGSTGSFGATGWQGAQGTNGPQGSQGPQGNTGQSGSGGGSPGAQGSQGVQGNLGNSFSTTSSTQYSGFWGAVKQPTSVGSTTAQQTFHFNQFTQSTWPPNGDPPNFPTDAIAKVVCIGARGVDSAQGAGGGGGCVIAYISAQYLINAQMIVGGHGASSTTPTMFIGGNGGPTITANNGQAGPGGNGGTASLSGPHLSYVQFTGTKGTQKFFAGGGEQPGGMSGGNFGLPNFYSNFPGSNPAAGNPAGDIFIEWFT